MMFSDRTSSVKARWKRALIQVESDAPPRALEIDLPGAATAFQIPDGFLEAGTEYVVDVQARHPSGNYTMSDVTFTTKN